jgi:hypothetical protein
MNDRPDAEGFARLIGERFTVEMDAADTGTAATSLVLESAVEVHAAPDSPRRRPFTLTFAGPGGDHLPQGIHDLMHPSLGTIGIFLVPIGPRSDGRHRYEAVFN